MSDREKRELVLQRVIHQLLKNQSSDRKEDKLDQDNSFIFLEKETLHLLVTHLLASHERKIPQIENENLLANVEGLLEQIAIENNKEFEELITSIKERF